MKSAYLTGAGSGIGRALARELWRAGYRLAALDRDRAALVSLAEEALADGSAIDVAVADVSDRAAFLAALDGLYAKAGPPRLFFNNAGIARVGGFLESGLDGFEKVLAVNLDGVVSGTHWALARMEKEGSGTIVNMSSTAGHVPAAFMASYCASKAAVIGFTRALQAELGMAKSSVTVCLVSPGFVDTPIMRQEKAPFPRFLGWLVQSPQQAARAVLAGVLKDNPEIVPDWGGWLMQKSYRLAPRLTVAASRLLLARSVWELAGLLPIEPGAKR